MQEGEGLRQYGGWRVVAASGAGVFFISVFVFTFGVLLRPLAAEFSWSREAVSRAFAAMTLSVSLAAPVMGHVVDRRGPRWIVGPSLAVAACAFASLSALTPNLWHLYAVFVVIGLASAGASPVVYARVVSTWFHRRRGMALGVVMASVGVGAIVHPPITQTLVNAVGWRRACGVLAAVILAVGVPTVARFVREREAGVVRAVAVAPGTALVDALRTRIYWTLILVVFGFTLVMNAAVVHLSALLTDRGLAASQAVAAMSVMGAASLTGRLFTGLLLDRFSAIRVSFVLMTIAAGGTLILSGAESMIVAATAAALIGLGTGGEADVIPYLLSRYFGLRSFSTLYGFIWLAFGLAGATGPILMGRAFDATGSYAGILVAFAAATFAVGALMLTLPDYRSPRADVVST